MLIKSYNESVEINHNANWFYILDHPYRNLFNSDSGSTKTNALLKLVKHKPAEIDEIHLFAKDPFELKNQLLINGRGKIGITILKIQKHSSIIHKQFIMSINI